MTYSVPVTAVVWDFDGTLVDTCAKNMAVNRRIIEEVTGRPATEFEVMGSQEAYDRGQRISVNWREFYQTNFGMSEAETDLGGSRWTPYQLTDNTPTPPLKGIPQALSGFDGLPLGVVSQNCSKNISTTLEAHGLEESFQCIIGYQEVAGDRQKPAPDGLLLAIEMLTGLAPGRVLYIGDHETDLKTVINTNRALGENDLPINVDLVAALYGMSDPNEGWVTDADHRAETPLDIVDLVERLK